MKIGDDSLMNQMDKKMMQPNFNTIKLDPPPTEGKQRNGQK